MFDFEQQRSTFLWPRYEVLQLVIPQIAGYNNGKALTYDLVFAAIRKLVKCQNPDGLISFDRWLVIAKDVLKWNDSIITIFWEILMMASWYVIDHTDQQKSSLLLGSFSGSSNNNINKFDSHMIASHAGVDINHLSIFLALHVDDTPIIPSSPRHSYDTMWPSSSLLEQRVEDTSSSLNMNMLSISASTLLSAATSAAHSPLHSTSGSGGGGGITLSNHSHTSSTSSSPSSSQHSTSTTTRSITTTSSTNSSNNNNNNNNISSPSKQHHPPTSSPIHSPRSLQGASAPTSPKRITPLLINSSSTVSTSATAANTLASHQTRSAAQHLFSLKQKIPFLLKVISTDELLSCTNNNLSVESSPVHESSGGSNNSSSGNSDQDRDYYNDRYDKSPRGSARASGNSSSSGNNNNNNNHSSSSAAANTAGLEFMISRAALDSLSLVIGGGLSRSENIKKLSCLHPYWLSKRRRRGSRSNHSNSLHSSREKNNNMSNMRTSSIGGHLQNISARDDENEEKEYKSGGGKNSSAYDAKDSNNSSFENSNDNKKRSISSGGATSGSISQRDREKETEDDKYDNDNDNGEYEDDNDIHSVADTLCFSELSAWIDDHLTINETFHPTFGSSSSSSSASALLTHSSHSASAAVALQHCPSYISLGGCGPSSNIDFKSSMLISPRNSGTNYNSNNGSGSGKELGGSYSSPRRIMDEFSNSSCSNSSAYISTMYSSPSSTPYPHNTSSSSSSSSSLSMLPPIQVPFRATLPLNEIQPSAPTIVRNCATTVIYNVTGNSNSGTSSSGSQPPSRVSSAPPSARSSQRENNNNNNNNKTAASSLSSSMQMLLSSSSSSSQKSKDSDDDIEVIDEYKSEHSHPHSQQQSSTNKKKDGDIESKSNISTSTIDTVDFGLSPTELLSPSSPRDSLTSSISPTATAVTPIAAADSKHHNDKDIMDNTNATSGSKHVTLPLFQKTNNTSSSSSTSTTAAAAMVDQLPHAVITGSIGAHIYLLAPYGTATLSHCADCEIVIGAVAGAVVMNFCERVSITTACRKLFVVGCVDCRINIATLSTSLILGDCRGNFFGPYNTVYKSLRNHMSVTHLQSLTSTATGSRHHSPDRNKIIGNTTNNNNNNSPPNLNHATTGLSNYSGSSGGGVGGGSLLHNHWSMFTDIISCLETMPVTAGSPSGYALDATAAVTLPQPPVSVAHQLPHDHFKPLSIPYVVEFENIQNCPIQLPMLYTRALQERNGKITDIRERLMEICSGSSSSGGDGSGSGNNSGDGGNNNNRSSSTRNRSVSTDTTGVAAEGRSRSSSKTEMDNNINNSITVTGASVVVPASLMSQLQLEECEGSGSDKSNTGSNGGGDSNNNSTSMNQNESNNQQTQQAIAAISTITSIPVPSPTFNKAFMEWMVATGRSQQLLQLVSLDATDAGLVFATTTTTTTNNIIIIPSSPSSSMVVDIGGSSTSASASLSSSLSSSAAFPMITSTPSGSGSSKNAPRPLDFSML